MSKFLLCAQANKIKIETERKTWWGVGERVEKREKQHHYYIVVD